MVISVNVLSQLSFCLLRWASQFDSWRTDRLASWECALQAAHVNARLSIPMLFSSRISALYGIRGQERSGVSTYWRKMFSDIRFLADMEWSFAPAPEEHRRWDVVHRVCAERVSSSLRSG